MPWGYARIMSEVNVCFDVQGCGAKGMVETRIISSHRSTAPERSRWTVAKWSRNHRKRILIGISRNEAGKGKECTWPSDGWYASAMDVGTSKVAKSMMVEVLRG